MTNTTTHHTDDGAILIEVVEAGNTETAIILPGLTRIDVAAGGDVFALDADDLDEAIRIARAIAIFSIRRHRRIA